MGNLETPPSDAARAALNDLSKAATRRRLLRGGLGASPVLLTLASRPVIATVCRTASASASANASRPGANQTPCIGFSPAAWVADSGGSWPPGVAKATALVATYFPAAPAPYSIAGTKLIDVLSSADPSSAAVLARAVVAALLNVRSGKTNGGVVSEAQLKTLWPAAVSPGGFSPTPGIVWNAVQTTAWLTLTFM